MAMNDPEVLHKFVGYTWSGVRQIFTEYNKQFIWEKNETILDVGCGTGQVISNLIEEFLPKDSTIVAGDISVEMLEFAKKHFDNSRITFKKLDILDDDLWKTFNKEEFSKIFSFYVFQRIADDSLRKAFENIYNLLEPGGEMLIMYPTNHELDNIAQYLVKLPTLSKYSEELVKVKYNLSACPDYLEHVDTLLKEYLFKRFSCQLMKIQYKFPSFDYVADLYGCGTTLDKHIPKESIPDVLKEVEKMVKDTNILEKTEDGGVIVHYEVIILNGVKSEFFHA